MPLTRLKLKGGWIDASFEDGTLLLAAVGPPLHYLVKPPTSIPGRHKQTEDRGRLRRMAVDALRDKGAADAIADAETRWTYRAG